jgi:hypothetical protein
MDVKSKLRKLLFVTSTVGFAVFAMVVITEIVRISIH